MRRFPEAAAATRAYFARYPDDYPFAQGMAKAFGGLSRFHEMALVLEPFVARKPSYEVYALTGFALGRVGRKAEAVALLEKAIAVEPENWWAYYFLGYVLGSINRRLEAVAAFEKALAIRPDFLEVRAEVANLRQLQAAVEAGERLRRGLR